MSSACAAVAAAPAASAERSTHLVVSVMPASRDAAWANGAAVPARGGHRHQPGRQRHTGDAELVIARDDAAPAVGAVVVATAHRDRAEHRVDRLGAVGEEAGDMPPPQSIRGPR